MPRLQRAPGAPGIGWRARGRGGLATHRQAYLDAVHTSNAEGKPARSGPIQFLGRHTAHHDMDKRWEPENRNLNLGGGD